MITPQEIKNKAQRKYVAFLQSIVESKNFEQIDIQFNKSYSKSTPQEFYTVIKQLYGQSKETKGFGYTVEYQKVKTRSKSIQDVPTSIYFDTEKDFLKFLDKEDEVESFKTDVVKIILAFPELKAWIHKNPIKVIDNRGKWKSLLRVCEYFKKNPRPNLYIRELPIEIHTKFIETNQSVIKALLNLIIAEHVNIEEKDFSKRFGLKDAEPLVRFKILDKDISQKLFSGIDDMAIPVSLFENLNLPIQKVLIVENKTTLYTALTLPRMNKSIAIFGSGYSVSMLKNVRWLDNLTLLYWGDLDAQGFEILSQFRNYFSHARSILMDKNTFDLYFENDQGQLTNNSTKLNLTDQEQQLYETLKTHNWRLEQEKVPFKYVNDYVQLNQL